MTQEELNLLKRIADALEKQADATDRMADYLSTIAYNVEQSEKEKGQSYFSQRTKKSKVIWLSKRKKRRMPIEDMPQEFLNEEREPVNYDALMDGAILPQRKKKKKSE